MEQLEVLNNYIANLNELYTGYINKETQKGKVTDLFKGWFAMNNPEKIMPENEEFLDKIKGYVNDIDKLLKNANEPSMQNQYACLALEVMLINREEKLTVSVEMYINAAQVYGLPLVKYLDTKAKTLLQKIMVSKTPKSLLLPNQKKLWKALCG